jgi:hypothetical protein
MLFLLSGRVSADNVRMTTIKEGVLVKSPHRAVWTAVFTALLVLTAPNFAFACNKTFVVYNYADNSIVSFYVAPTSANSWEDNVLSSAGAIEPDTTKRINMSSDTRNVSLYDVRAIFDDGTKIEGGKINLCRAQRVNIYDDHVTFSE